MRQYIREASKRLDALVHRYTHPDETAFVSLQPEGTPCGNVLMAYIIDPFLLKEGETVSNSHTNHWESLQMAQAFLDLGYAVDVISYRNTSFRPRKKYTFFLSARTRFVKIAERLNPDCIKIVHLDMAHWLYNNTAAYQRSLAVQQRRGVAIGLHRKLQEQNWAIEHADYATILGNEFTTSTYRYADKPIYRVPIPNCATYPWPEDKDFDAVRKRFIWFGSDGLVHKGLDLTLEAFAQMPEYHLTVCGPIARDKGFAQAYHKELYETPNIHTADWVDIEGPEFAQIFRNSVGLVYPTCSEGGGGSVITCMHAGLIPVVSYEASVDIEPTFGVLLNDNTIEAIQESVRTLSQRPAEQLERMARGAWQTARTRYTRARHAEEFRAVIEQIMLERGLEVVMRQTVQQCPVSHKLSEQGPA